MSRMLKALRQIEARSPKPQEESESVQPEEGRSPPPADATLGGEAAIEASLQQMEDAAAEAANELAEKGLAGVELAGPADRPFMRWPGQPTEDHARAYGKLADNILSRLPRDDRATLMFTSPCDGAGTSGLLVPLGAAIAARTSAEVLLVDSNLRKPALARYLGMEATRGLGDVLLGVATWQQVVRSTVVERLSVVPGMKFLGPADRSPGQIQLGPLLTQLSGESRLVLIDTASLVHPEVAPMASWCTGTYLVVRLNHTSRRAVAEALEVIQNCGGCVLGSVLLGA